MIRMTPRVSRATSGPFKRKCTNRIYTSNRIIDVVERPAWPNRIGDADSGHVSIACLVDATAGMALCCRTT